MFVEIPMREMVPIRKVVREIQTDRQTNKQR